MKAFVIKAGSTSLDGLVQVEKEKPQAGTGEILVEMKSAAINFRDLLISAGKYFGGPVAQDTIPLSDGAGEVIAVGADVTRFKIGDRVAGTFFRNYIDGPAAPVERPSLGSPVDGVLAEYVVFNQEDAVHIPANLSYMEACTLPCAGVTAWHSLMVAGTPLQASDTVLLLGTGGVSLFALQIAKAAGAKTIITSSSDEKLAKAKGLGATESINYKTTPEWDEEVMKLSGGLGANCVIEVGGVGTLNNSMKSLAFAGKIALIGVLSGAEGNPQPHALMLKGASMHGIFVGNRSMFESLNNFIESHDIHPVIESVFDFDDAAEGYKLMQSQSHFGKIVVNI